MTFILQKKLQTTVWTSNLFSLRFSIVPDEITEKIMASPLHGRSRFMFIKLIPQFVYLKVYTELSGLQISIILTCVSATSCF